jgi:hypothetical protein
MSTREPVALQDGKGWKCLLASSFEPSSQLLDLPDSKCSQREWRRSPTAGDFGRLWGIYHPLVNCIGQEEISGPAVSRKFVGNNRLFRLGYESELGVPPRGS